MGQELQGLEFLKKNEIVDKKCRFTEPFAFISYSHDTHDAAIVREVFVKLYEKGYNLWIDTANIPYNESEWSMAAIEALKIKEFCKFAFYFRSESSMIKETIEKELYMIKQLTHIGDIVTVDIWEDRELSAEKYKCFVLNEKSPGEYRICDAICDIVKTGNSAIRFAKDLNNDIDRLVDVIIKELEKRGVHKQIVQSTEISWNEFDNIKAFSYQGNAYLVSDARQAYCAIVDMFKKAHPEFQTEKIIEGETGYYVRFDDGSELDMVNGGYGMILKSIKEIRNCSDLTLYRDVLPNAKKIPIYEILKRGEKPNTTGEFVDFGPEPFVGFACRHKKILQDYKKDWQQNNTKQVPPIPFTRLQIHMPKELTGNLYIAADNWKQLFNTLMDTFCAFTNTEYGAYRQEMEAKKGLKGPAVITKADYDEGKVKCARYQPIKDTEYYFYNSYEITALLNAMDKEIKLYIDYSNNKKGTQTGIEEIEISYSLPKGEYADMFS